MKTMRPVLVLTLFFLFAACNNATEMSSDNQVDQKTETTILPEVTQLPIVEDMEAAHKVAQFKNKEAIQFDIELYFGGSKRLDGTIISKTNSTGVRLEKADGSVIGYDGRQVWMSPADAEVGGARFDIFTWQYFFMAPFKFRDPGTNWEALEDMMLDGKPHTTARLTFDIDTGDAPEDWYIVYKDKSTNLLDAMAYIVTFRASQEQAEEEPHAITYHNYEEVDGIPIAKEWKFWLWTEDKGIHQQLGNATITNVEFVEVKEADFTSPDDSQTVKR